MHTGVLQPTHSALKGCLGYAIHAINYVYMKYTVTNYRSGIVEMGLTSEIVQVMNALVCLSAR